LKCLISICSLFFCIQIGHTQDLHFTQYFNNPIGSNPANTGFAPDADFRAGVQYRNQFSSIIPVPFKTWSAFADAQLLGERLSTGWMGVGFLMMSDVAGSGLLSTNRAYGSVAYHQMLDQSNLLSIGFNVGWVGKQINLSKLRFPDQFNGVFFDANLPTQAQLANSSFNYLDLHAGLNYAYFPTEDMYLNFGYSVQHFNRPNESFFTEKRVANRLDMRHSLFVHGDFKLSNSILLLTNLYFTTMAKARQMQASVMIDINLAQNGETQLLLGAAHRFAESLIPMVGLTFNNWNITCSYDATVSGLRNYNQLRGATEFSLIKKGIYPTGSNKSIRCPRF
jgi:type IX secretion system PorP/SprF family membrane protein